VKILMVSGIYPPDSGGPACYVPRMAEALVERGHEVTVLCLGKESGREKGNGFQVERIRREMFWPARVIWTLIRITRNAAGRDVVFVNGLAAEAALGARLLNKPTVHKVVGDTAWERAVGRGWFSGSIQQFQNAQGWMLDVLKFIRSTPLFWADAVITPSRYLAEMVWAWRIPSHRVQVVHNSADARFGGTATSGVFQSRKIGGVRGAYWTVITVCRLVPWKGVKELIGAMREMSGTRLWVVGDGGQRNELENEAALSGVRDRVEFFGARPRQEVFDLLKEADAFVLNSTYEGLPHVVLEAMAAGLPVIATSVGGTPEVVENGKTGLLVEPGNEADLVTALNRLKNTPELGVALAQEAMRRLSENWSEWRMVAATESVLAGAAANGGAK
jgi:glycosyltransferase involved in cell wall biosynthesis